MTNEKTNEATPDLSATRLAELKAFIQLVKRMIEEEWSVTGTFGDDGIGQACKDAEDIAALLAEVDRLRRVPDAAGNLWLGNRDIWREREAALLAERVRLLALARVVAEGVPVSIDEDMWGLRLRSLRQRDVQAIHAQARALVADVADVAGDA